LIHEVLHIPHCFGGGFRAHKPYVTTAKVQKMYYEFIKVDPIEKKDGEIRR
jgi:predicted metallopeptidase